MNFLFMLLLFVITAIAEIVGCYLPYLWLKQGKSAKGDITGNNSSNGQLQNT